MNGPALSAAAVALHVIASTWWVGGMLFAYWILRPAAGAMEGPDRLKLWGRVFDLFFKTVWVAVVLIPATGYWMVNEIYRGFESAGQHVHAMHILGWIMITLFAWLYFKPYARFKDQLAADDFKGAAASLGTIRRIVATNSTLGAGTVLIASSGAYWG
ncbi:MAG: CopD family protein [Rhodospirillales bacterium]